MRELKVLGHRESEKRKNKVFFKEGWLVSVGPAVLGRTDKEATMSFLGAAQQGSRT